MFGNNLGHNRFGFEAEEAKNNLFDCAGRCSICLGELYRGERVYRLFEEIICPECVEKNRIWL